MLLFLLVIVHLAHIIMQRNINQGRVVRKELWAAKSDDMGAVKRQHGHLSTRCGQN